MNFATWSIRNPVPALVLFTMLTMAGLYGYRNLAVQDFPDMDMPTVNVTLTMPGAAPAQMETEVARIVEDSLATLTGLNHLRTSISDGLVTIGVEFVLEKRLSDAVIETKDAVDRVRADLPSAVEPPSVSAVNVAGQEPLLTLAVANPALDEEALSWFVDDTVGKVVLGVPGVGNFARVGGVTREVRVEVSPARLTALGVTAADVSRALRQVQQEVSGGRGQLGGAEQGVRTIATVAHADDLRALPVALNDGRHVRLDQVATVTDSYAERSQAAMLDGRPVVGFQVMRARGYDEVTTAAQVERALETLVAAHPGLSITRVAATVDFTVEQYEGSMHMLYEGALLAILVVWWFLRDWRATLVSAAALPLSIIPTFAAMYWLNYSLNTVTLLALAAIVGILVDDAIVEIENIVRHLRTGKPVHQAAAEAVTEIGLAVIATTATLVAVFMPTAFMPGIPGMIFRQFGWTAVIAVLVSLLVARILTPMMAAYILKPHAPVSEDNALLRNYLRAVNWCLVHRKTATLGAAIFFVASLALVPLLPAGLIPAQDRGFTKVSVELPPGSALASTLATAERARMAIGDIPGIAGILTTVGEAQQTQGLGVAQAGEVRRASLTVNLLPRGQRGSQLSIENEMRRRLLDIPGARFAIGAGGAPGEKLAVTLGSENAPALKATAQALERELRGITYLSNISSTASLERPELVIRPDPVLMAERGVTTAAVGETVRIATSGDFDAQLSKLNLESRQVDIRVRVADAERSDMSTFANLRVAGRDGPVPLASVADISLGSGPVQIERFDRQRYVTVNADLGGAPLGEALAAAQALPALANRPSTVEFIETGDAELMVQLFSGFGMAMVTGIICVLAVLVLLFKDVLQPFTILSALPLSVGGSLLALLVTGSSLTLPALIGMVMLMGIVTKNSILLVEYTIVGMREHGLDRHDALIDACRKRARPIVMTTVAMIAGMLPLALGFGADASFRQPMAITVIGGLITSTALSLLIVPVVFMYAQGFEMKVRQLLGRPEHHGNVQPQA
ncbi:MAG: efflux RND transporter permease subunit [Gammaproteobacteria bacterium]|nr:efflux RND transporter permease subunit [Gammaproteobacteria bacterium]